MDFVYLALSILLFIKTNVWFVFNANKGKVLQFFTWIEKVPRYWSREISLAGSSIFPQNFKDFWKHFITLSYSSLLLSSSLLSYHSCSGICTFFLTIIVWPLYTDLLPSEPLGWIFFPTLHQPIFPSLSYISFAVCLSFTCILGVSSCPVSILDDHQRLAKSTYSIFGLDILFNSLQPQLYCLLFI